jgi:tRNA threonylcarbamoyl adenosine modification protein YeaZ
MRILAIDTSLDRGSVAALEGDRVASRPLDAAAAHARLLAPAIVDVAADLGWQPRDARLVAVVRGPGSFTGLRIGVATAKGIAWAADARLAGVSGFEIIARQTARSTGHADRPVAVAYDAGRGDVYAAVVRPEPASPTGWHVEPATLQRAAEWADTIPPGGWLAGPALEVPGLLACHRLPAGAELAPPEAWRPVALEAAAVAWLRLASGATPVADERFSLVPEYMRPTYADERAAASLPRGDDR